jgi:hypothetical protein
MKQKAVPAAAKNLNVNPATLPNASVMVSHCQMSKGLI